MDKISEVFIPRKYDESGMSPNWQTMPMSGPTGLLMVFSTTARSSSSPMNTSATLRITDHRYHSIDIVDIVDIIVH